MTTRTSYGRLILAAVALGLAACAAGGPAGGGEEHEHAGGVVTLWTDSTELFMEYPALIVGEAGTFAAHLTDLTDFRPLETGRVVFRLVPRDGGEPVVVVEEAPSRPGIYGPEPVFTRPGVYDLTIEVEGPQARDMIEVPGLRVYASAADAPHEEGGDDGGIAFLKEQQWKTPGFRTAFAVSGAVSESFAATGEIVPAAGRFAQVAAPIGGLVDARGVASSPAPGQRVGRSQVLAVLTPTLGEGGGSAYALARRELREAEDEHARAERLYEVEAIPERRLHEARIRLDAAREALAGLGGGDAAEGGRLAVRSPIAGVVAERSIVPGSRVEAGAPLFTVVDPSVVWLRVDVPSARAPRVEQTSGASFRIGGLDRVYETRRAVSVGSVVDPRSRTVPVIYEVDNADGTLRIGAIANVQVRMDTQVQGVVIPSTAILEEDGRPVAFVQTEGETFERRELTVSGSEGGLTLVLSGIREGERVVTGAAYQVRLASLSTAVPEHGHEH